MHAQEETIDHAVRRLHHPRRDLVADWEAKKVPPFEPTLAMEGLYWLQPSALLVASLAPWRSAYSSSMVHRASQVSHVPKLRLWAILSEASSLSNPVGGSTIDPV